jgi:hypothetical protein
MPPFAPSPAADNTAAITDDELAALALAADPDAPLPTDAVSLWDLDATDPACCRTGTCPRR